MSDILNLPSDYLLQEHVLIAQGAQIGILNPGIVFASTDEAYLLQIIGPAGAVIVPANDGDAVVAGLIKTRSILFGSDEAIIQANNYLQNPRTSRTASYLCSVANTCDELNEAFVKWSRVRVAIVGCGGIGSLSAMLMAGAGVRSIILIDSDRIEASNLNRQLFWSKADIGHLKVEVLAQRLIERFDDLEIQTNSLKLHGSMLNDLISDADAFLFTADEPIGLVRDARRLAEFASKPFVSAGYTLNNVVISNHIDSHMYDRRQLYTSPHKIAPSFGPMNAEAAGAASALLMCQIAGIGEKNQAACFWNVHQWPRIVK